MARSAPAGLPVALAGALLAALAGCDTATEPLEPGTIEFELVAEGASTPSTWSASGSCGPRGFPLGSTTCAVGTEETRYRSVLGVIAHEDGTYDYIVLAAPKRDGTCAVSPETGGTEVCTASLVRGATDVPEEEVASYLLTTGTITAALEGGRLVGSFEGTAEDQSGLELPPLTITDGTFDVEFVR